MNESYNDIYKYVSRKTFFASLLMMCAFCLLCMFTAIFSNSTSTAPASSHINQDEYIAASVSPSMYILRSVNGCVAVCDFTDGVPIEILDVDIHSLPEDEQLALESGICVTSISELVATIESYTS